MAGEILAIMTFLAEVMASVFGILDGAYIETGISMLDIFLAIMYLDITVWFTLKLISKSGGKSDDESEKGNKPHIPDEHGNDGAY